MRQKPSTVKIFALGAGQLKIKNPKTEAANTKHTAEPSVYEPNKIVPNVINVENARIPQRPSRPSIKL